MKRDRGFDRIATRARFLRLTLRLVAIGLTASVAAAVAAWPARAGARQAQTPATAADSTTAKKLTRKLKLEAIVSRLPQRVTSKNGTPGDMVNFLLVGARDQVKKALAAAGWVPVDANVQDALSHALQDVLEHRAYSQMPMSQLYLFGRAQDMGYAEGIPLAIMQDRNHFRLWQAPWLSSDGQTIWVGAGTHDTGFERDSAGKLTHSIDPDLDHEREYIVNSLRRAGEVKSVDYLLPKDPLRKGLTATGDPFHSDGRVAAIFLK